MITTILFDLDGTLLPMDQDRFIEAYVAGLTRKAAHQGYDPQLMPSYIWKATGAMYANDGSVTNEDVFWNTFSALSGRNAREDIPVFEDFYRNEFQALRSTCGFDPQAMDAIRQLKSLGFRVALATNPLFPAIATHSRVRWAGLEPEDFELVTTFEASRHCKPNPAYYQDVLDALGVRPEECLMVGNDVGEDMVAGKLGIQVFLLTDCLINKAGSDIRVYPHGSFPELLDFVRRLR